MALDGYMYKDLKKIERGFNRHLKMIRGDLQSGIVAAAMHLRRESQKITPYKYGNLVNSAYVMWPGKLRDKPKEWKDKRGDVDELERGHEAHLSVSKSIMRKNKILGPVAIVGYTAYYAPYVHEIPRNKYTKKGTGPYFLMKAFDQNKKEMLKIIKRRAKKWR